MDYKEQKSPSMENIFLKGSGIKSIKPPTNEDIEYENDLKFPDTSRYKFTPVIKYKDGRCFRIWNIPKFEKTENDSFYKISSGNTQRLDLISYKMYKTVDLWWVIAVTNNVLDPFIDLEVGKLLRIPSIVDIYSRVVKGL